MPVIPSYTLLSSAGTYVKNVDPTLAPTTVSVTFSTATTTATYSLDYTLQDAQYLAAIGSTIGQAWLADTVLTSSNTPRATSFSFPIAGVRVNLTALASGSALLSILQRDD